MYPDHYEAINKSAAIIEHKISDICNKLKNIKSIPRIAFNADTDNWTHNITNLAKMSEETLPLNTKLYWIIKRYVLERLTDAQDVEDILNNPKIKLLVENVTEQSINEDAIEGKKIVDRRVRNIRFAEKKIRFVKDELPLINQRTYSNDKKRVLNKLLNRNTSVVNGMKSVSKSLLRLNLQAQMGQSITLNDLKKQDDKPKDNQNITRKKPPYSIQAASIIKECKNWEHSYNSIRRIYRKAKDFLNKSAKPKKSKTSLPNNVIRNSLDHFHNERSFFIYGNQGSGSFLNMHNKKNAIQKSDSLAKLNPRLASIFLKDYFKYKNKEYLKF